MTTTDRLLSLWKRCQSCAPVRVGIMADGTYGMGTEDGSRVRIHTDDAQAIICDALERWLTTRYSSSAFVCGWNDTCGWYVDTAHGTPPEWTDREGLVYRATKLESLIAAVEAIIGPELSPAPTTPDTAAPRPRESRGKEATSDPSTTPPAPEGLRS